MKIIENIGKTGPEDVEVFKARSRMLIQIILLLSFSVVRYATKVKTRNDVF